MPFCCINRVFVRADFNVPLEKGVITDDTRIRGAIPTIKYLTSKGAKVILSSHLGRPKGGFEAKFSLAPITPRLAELLGQPVALVSDCIGEPVKTAVAAKSAMIARMMGASFTATIADNATNTIILQMIPGVV